MLPPPLVSVHAGIRPALLVCSLCLPQGHPMTVPLVEWGSPPPGLYFQTALLVSPGSLSPGTR